MGEVVIIIGSYIVLRFLIKIIPSLLTMGNKW